MSRRSTREKSIKPLPNRLKSLFFEKENEDTCILSKGMKKICNNPPLYFIENFLSSKDIDHFDCLCTQYGAKFGSSFVEDEENNEVLSELRTSKFIHLSKAQDPVIRRIEQRAAELIGITQELVEPLQIVSYKDGQLFDTHHDAGTYDDATGNVELVLPRRYATLFVYLNTLPDGQGCTEFPSASSSSSSSRSSGMQVTPRRGCAVLWSNILPNGQADVRTIHRACPVVAPYVKYGVNIWMSETNMQPLALVKSKTLVDNNIKQSIQNGSNVGDGDDSGEGKKMERVKRSALQLADDACGITTTTTTSTITTAATTIATVPSVLVAKKQKKLKSQSTTLSSSTSIFKAVTDNNINYHTNYNNSEVKPQGNKGKGNKGKQKMVHKKAISDSDTTSIKPKPGKAIRRSHDKNKTKGRKK